MMYEVCDDVIAIREALFKHEMKATVNKQGIICRVTWSLQADGEARAA
jgi:hypothetical protein